MQIDKSNLVILKVMTKSKRAGCLHVLVDSGASSNFVRHQSLSLLDFEEVKIPRSRLEVRLATGAVVKTEERVIRSRFSYKHRVFVEGFIVLDLDDKFDMVLGMPWLTRQDPVIDWEKRTITLQRDRERWPCQRGACTSWCIRTSSRETTAHAAVSSRSAPGAQAATTPGVVSGVGGFGPGPNTANLNQSDSKRSSAAKCRGDNSVPTPGVDTNSISTSSGDSAKRRSDKDASTPGVDAASSADGCKRPAPDKLASCRAAGLHEAECAQAGLDDARPRIESAGGTKEDPSTAGPGHKTCGAGLHKKQKRKPRSRTEALQEMSAGQTKEPTTDVETLNVLTRTCTGFQYKNMELENPPTSVSEMSSLPAMSWKRFAKDLYDGRIVQICILSDLERMKIEAQELRQLLAGSTTESGDALSVKTKKQCFEEQSWDSLKSSLFYKILREQKDVFPDEIPAELPQDKGIQHEIDLVPGTKYYVTRQWPPPREQVKAIDDFFESRRNAGQVRESISLYGAPTFCVKKPQGGWRIVHAYNKLNDATVPAQTPISRKDVIIDSMAKSTIYSALDLRDGFYQILMRESDVPLTAVSTPSGMLWEWLVMPQGLKNAPATFNRCVTHLLRSVREFTPSYFDDVFVHSRAVNGKTDIEMHRVHLRKLLELMRKHKFFANLKKCIFGASEIPVLGCLVGKNGVRPDPEKVRVINEWPTPSNVKELRQFLGLATYLCKYVENYAGKIRPLSQLLKKEAAWIWTADCQQAFDAVKQGLTEASILAVADQDRPFHIVCDATDFAIGCALMQLDHEGSDRVVYYQSRPPKPAERNYPVHDKERLAIKNALTKFRVYLLG
ncbi:reverse transcriptase [Phytophthora palmivora]|uniref:Reverse transcriptase n=1 Tax=Phytophthora palmivora TaxID=4796 RepID=A0A2P4X2U3_9STRA|nr:reverse transcriptase [Phytophthora palmivora]